MEAARKAEAEALTQTLLHNPVSYVAQYPEFPWSLITTEQGKICSRISDDLKPLDFSSKSLKSWATHFKDLFSKKFIHERVARISIVYNSCSSPLQQQLLSLNIGAKTEDDEFNYSEFLQVICTLANSPNQTELALQQLYGGLKQKSQEYLGGRVWPLIHVDDESDQYSAPEDSWSSTKQESRPTYQQFRDCPTLQL